MDDIADDGDRSGIIEHVIENGNNLNDDDYEGILKILLPVIQKYQQ